MNKLSRFFSIKRVDTSKDWYKILQLQKNADEKQIKENYYELAKKYHPDRTGGSDQSFKEINQAYSILGDPAQKSNYDHLTQNLNNTQQNQQKIYRSRPFNFKNVDKKQNFHQQNYTQNNPFGNSGQNQWQFNQQFRQEQQVIQLLKHFNNKMEEDLDNVQEKQDKITLKIIVYPTVAFFIYYFTIHLPMSLSSKSNHKIVYDEKTGAAHVVRGR